MAFGCQSSIKESVSKKLVQRVLVLLWLWRKVQFGAVSPLLWTWTWRTQRRSGHGWHLGHWMSSVGMWVVCCWLWSVFFGRVSKFGSGIILSGDLVLDFNYFKKFQVFKFLNLVGFNVSIFISECSSKPYPTCDGLSHRKEACRGGWGILN